MKNKSFTFLWAGQLLANCGDVFYVVGMISAIYGMNGSAAVAALFPFTNTIAQFISGFAAPLLIDRVRLKSLLVWSQAGKTILLLALGLHYFNEAASINLVLVFSLVFIISFLDGWANPAKNAMLPRLVKRKELVKANSFVAVLDQIVFTGGWALGGVAVAMAGGGTVLLATIVLFLASTVLMALIKDPFKPDKNQHAGPIPKMKSFREGWGTIWKVPALRAIHVVFVLESMAGTVWIAAVIYVYVQEQLQAGEAWWGYINAGFFIGMLIGGLAGMKLSAYIGRHLKLAVVSSSIAVAIATALFGLSTVPFLALAFSMISGVAESVKGIAVQSIVQSSVAVEALPKIYAAQSALIAVFFGFSSLAVGYIAEYTTIAIPFLISAFLLAGSAVYAAAKLTVAELPATNQTE